MLFGCTPNNEDYSYLVSKDYIPTDVEIIEEDNFKNAAIKLKTERDIKVLQLTDIHFGNGALSVKKDTIPTASTNISATASAIITSSFLLFLREGFL